MLRHIEDETCRWEAEIDYTEREEEEEDEEEEEEEEGGWNCAFLLKDLAPVPMSARSSASFCSCSEQLAQRTAHNISLLHVSLHAALFDLCVHWKSQEPA